MNEVIPRDGFPDLSGTDAQYTYSYSEMAHSASSDELLV